MVAGKAQPGKVQGSRKPVRRNFFGSESFPGFGRDFANKRFHRWCILKTGGKDSGGEIAPMMKPFAVVREMTQRLIREPEVGKKETLRL